MSTSTVITAADTRTSGALSRLADYAELTKPRILIMVLVTVTLSALTASWGQPDIVRLMHTLLGTTLVAASASALNQWWERATDARMLRTADRPLPAGRLGVAETLILGLDRARGGTGLPRVELWSGRDDLGGAHLVALRRSLYTAQVAHRVEHGRGGHSGSLAGRDWLDGCGSVAGLAHRVAVPAGFFLAVSALHGDCLALPTAVRRRESADVDGRRSLRRSCRLAGGDRRDRWCSRSACWPAASCLRFRGISWPAPAHWVWASGSVRFASLEGGMTDRHDACCELRLSICRFN